MPAQTRHADVVFVQMLALVGIGLHRFEHHPVLLQHHPVARLEPVLVQEAPGIALPAADLAQPPVEHRGHVFDDRRVAADDGERTARTAGLGIRNRQPHPVQIGITPFGPVKVHATLAGLLEHEAMLGAAQLELGADVALAHRMRLLVHEGAVHRIDHVVLDIPIVGAPFGVAKKPRPFPAGHLFGQTQRWWFGQMRVGGVEQEHGAVAFLYMEAARGLAAFERAAGAGRHPGHRTVAAHFDTVVRAGQPVTQVHTHRQRRAAVRAMVFECMHCAIAVAPQGDLVAEPAQRDRRILDKGRRTHRVPQVAQATGQQGIDLVS